MNQSHCSLFSFSYDYIFAPIICHVQFLDISIFWLINRQEYNTSFDSPKHTFPCENEQMEEKPTA